MHYSKQVFLGWRSLCQAAVKSSKYVYLPKVNTPFCSEGLIHQGSVTKFDQTDYLIMKAVRGSVCYHL